MTGALDAVAKRNRQIDWFRILADLDKAGVDNAAVAKLLHVGKATIHRWKMGQSEPRYTDGVALLAMSAEVPRMEPQEA